MGIKLTVKIPIHQAQEITVTEADILCVKEHSFMAFQNGVFGSISKRALVKLFDGNQYEVFDFYEDIVDQLDEVEFIQATTIEGVRITFQRRALAGHDKFEDYRQGIRQEFIKISLRDGKTYIINGDYSQFLNLMNA